MVLDAPPVEISPQRVLVLDTAWIGDIVFTTSLLGAVRAAWPAAELHMLTVPRGAPLLAAWPGLARLWVFDKRGSDRSPARLFTYGKKLAAERFDVVLNTHPSLRSRLLTRLTRAPIRVGYNGWGARYCLTHAIPNDLAVEPDHVARRIALLTALGVTASPQPLRVCVAGEAALWAEDFIQRHDVASSPVLGLIVGSAWQTKCWPADNFSGLARRWCEATEGVVLVFGGPQDRELIAAVCGGKPRIIGVCGEALPRVSALLARCATVVGNDTGISFLALAAGTPQVIVLYGCTQVNYHFPPPHRALTAGVPCCLPRTGHGAHACQWAERPWCMEQITLNAVWAAIYPCAKSAAIHPHT